MIQRLGHVNARPEELCCQVVDGRYVTHIEVAEVNRMADHAVKVPSAVAQFVTWLSFHLLLRRTPPDFSHELFVQPHPLRLGLPVSANKRSKSPGGETAHFNLVWGVGHDEGRDNALRSPHTDVLGAC